MGYPCSVLSAQDFFFTVMRLLFWTSVGPVLYRLCGRRNVCILTQKSLVRDFTMFALPVALRRRNWQFAWDWQAACQPHGEWRTQLLHWFADRTVPHPPCQHGLSSDGQRAKQRGSQKWSSEHYFGAVYDCEENLKSIRRNITADGVESWWLTWWIPWWVSSSKLSWVAS